MRITAILAALGLGFFASSSFAQIVQFAATARLLESMQTGWRQDVVRLGSAAISFGIRERRQHEISRRLAQERALIKEPLMIGDLHADAFEANLARYHAAQRITDR